MSKKTKTTAIEKLRLILEFKNKKISTSEFCRINNCDPSNIKRWIVKYENNGSEGLEEIVKKRVYTYETIKNAITDYLNKEGPLIYIVKKYNISSDATLRYWLKWYNNPKWDFIGGDMSRIKKSLEEKLECVLECIENNKKCNEVSKEYNITAHQLRDWIRRYKIEGVSGLEDSRGQKKDNLNLSNEEILVLKTKELEEQNLRLKAEVAILKKLSALRNGLI